MTHHWDYSGKTKSERRERAEEKKRERMEQGKRAKLLHAIIMKRAAEAQRDHDQRLESENDCAKEQETEG